jgi:hypothetical protein
MRPQAAPKTSKADQDREITRKSFVWTRRGVIVTAVGVVVAVIGVVVAIVAMRGTSDQETVSQQPKGVAVNTVPLDPIGGARIYPVPVVTDTPVAYLSEGVQLRIDCLQEVDRKYLLAQISSGPYRNEWIDALDIQTPEGQDVQRLSHPLPVCNAK